MPLLQPLDPSGMLVKGMLQAGSEIHGSRYLGMPVRLHKPHSPLAKSVVWSDFITDLVRLLARQTRLTQALAIMVKKRF